MSFNTFLIDTGGNWWTNVRVHLGGFSNFCDDGNSSFYHVQMQKKIDARNALESNGCARSSSILVHVRLVLDIYVIRFEWRNNKQPMLKRHRFFRHRKSSFQCWFIHFFFYGHPNVSFIDTWCFWWSTISESILAENKVIISSSCREVHARAKKHTHARAFFVFFWGKPSNDLSLHG